MGNPLSFTDAAAINWQNEWKNQETNAGSCEEHEGEQQITSTGEGDEDDQTEDEAKRSHKQFGLRLHPVNEPNTTFDVSCSCVNKNCSSWQMLPPHRHFIRYNLTQMCNLPIKQTRRPAEASEPGRRAGRRISHSCSSVRSQRSQRRTNNV